jgi:pyruvate/2-oxoglutarate dehydrogenase complex dihydrolipoamide acyltransferase (E2) component
LPETLCAKKRNEKIEGDKATLEVKNFENGQFEEIPFIKEDGAWRIALDQVVEEINEEETGEQPDSNTSDSNVSNSGGNSSPAGASSNQAANKNP